MEDAEVGQLMTERDQSTVGSGRDAIPTNGTSLESNSSGVAGYQGCRICIYSFISCRVAQGCQDQGPRPIGLVVDQLRLTQPLNIMLSSLQGI